MSGKRTSVWLPQDVIDAWHESGLSLADLVKLGLANRGPTIEERLSELEREVRQLRSQVSFAAGLRAAVGAVQSRVPPWDIPDTTGGKLSDDDQAALRQAADRSLLGVPVKRAEPPKLFGPEVKADRQD